jgi:2-haloacid dehalogenase
MKLGDFKVLTFDCYGTLIDWETGILTAIAPLTHRLSLTSKQMLEAFARHEAAQESETPTMIYSSILERVYKRMAEEWNVAASDADAVRFGTSVGNWPAFEDSPAALQYLKRHFKLVILSNIDRKSFAGSNAHLQVEFDQIYTAEDIGSYKPSLQNFEYMVKELSALGYAKRGILHTAESLFHDHAPANQMGLASAWIHRRYGKEGFGATARPKELPHYDFRFTSLKEMATAHTKELKDHAA